MNISMSATQTSDTRLQLYLAWGVVLLLTLPQIILGGFMHMDTAWLIPARIILLAILVALTFVSVSIRPLRGLFLIFLVVYAVEGWFFLTLVPSTTLYQNLFGSNSNLAFFGERLMRLGAVLVMILVLLGMGFKRRDFYLAVGDLNAIAEPSPRGIPRKPESWHKFGRNYALISVGLLLLFMVPAFQPSFSKLSIGVLLFAALCAAMNAFAEEFLYRSALLPQVLPLFGKYASLLLVPLWFGLAHYFGVPNGITGVIITAIGGWFFAKSMIETRGMGWAWFLHFLADFTVYLVLILAGQI
jgi:uncharacterized protein